MRPTRGRAQQLRTRNADELRGARDAPHGSPVKTTLACYFRPSYDNTRDIRDTHGGREYGRTHVRPAQACSRVIPYAVYATIAVSPLIRREIIYQLSRSPAEGIMQWLIFNDEMRIRERERERGRGGSTSGKDNTLRN